MNRFLSFILTLQRPMSTDIETSQLICFANQLTAFYIRGTLVVKGLIMITKMNWLLLQFVWLQPHSQSIDHFVGNKARGESESGGTKKTKHAKFSKKNEHFLFADTHTYVGVRNFRFSKNLACFVFLLPPFWDFLFFCLISNEFLERNFHEG